MTVIFSISLKLKTEIIIFFFNNTFQGKANKNHLMLIHKKTDSQNHFLYPSVQKIVINPGKIQEPSGSVSFHNFFIGNGTTPSLLALLDLPIFETTPMNPFLKVGFRDESIR